MPVEAFTVDTHVFAVNSRTPRLSPVLRGGAREIDGHAACKGPRTMIQTSRSKASTRHAIAKRPPARERLCAVVGGLALATVSCGAPEPDAADDPSAGLATSSDALYGLRFGTKLWPGGTVPVCWEIGSDTGTLEGDGSSTPIDGVTLKRQIRTAIENGWGHAANLRFTGWDTCPDTRADHNPGRIAVHWEVKGGINSETSIGYSSTQWTRSRINPTGGLPIEAIALHEFGHALGFNHEQERPDNWDSKGNPIHCALMDGTTKALRGGIYLTSTFDDQSIMSYCALSAGQTTLSAGDIAGVQYAYGRKMGMIVGPNNRCVEVPLTNGDFAVGTQLALRNCTPAANSQWQHTGNSQLYLLDTKFISKSYVDVRNNETGDHGIVQAFTLKTPAAANQQWAYDLAQVQGMGFQCVFASGPPANGVSLKLGSCVGADSKWTITPTAASTLPTTVTLRQGNFCWDVPNGTIQDGANIQLYGCHGGDSQKFSLASGGQIRFGAANGKCLDVRADNQQLQLYTCKPFTLDIGSFNQLFNLHTRIRGFGGKCLDIPNADASDGVGLQTYSCNGGANQTWDIFF